MRDHAEVSDAAWYPDERWLWRVDMIGGTIDGVRFLCISHEDGRRRVVREDEVSSNAFQVARAADPGEQGGG